MLFLLKRYKRERIIAQGINKREVRFVPLKKVGIACVVYYVTSQQSAQQLPQVVELLEESGIKFKILLLEKKRGLLKKLGLLPLREDNRYVVQLVGHSQGEGICRTYARGDFALYHSKYAGTLPL